MMDHGFFDGSWRTSADRGGKPYIFSPEFREHLRKRKAEKAAATGGQKLQEEIMSEPSEAMIEARKMWVLAAATLERDVLLHGMTADEQDVMIGAMLNAFDRARPIVGDEQLLREALFEARAVISALLVVEEVARKIVETFEKDEAQGYRSSARTYVLDMLRPALARRPLVEGE